MKRIAIIGAGVIGLSTAWYCRRRGWEVTVIDRGADRRDGCSYGNAGMVVPSHFVPLAAPGMIRLGLKWFWNPESPFAIRPSLSWDLISWLWRFRGFCTPAHVQRTAPTLRDLHLRSRGLYEQLQTELPGGVGFTPRGLVMLCHGPHGLAEETHAAELAKKLGVAAELLGPEELKRLEPNVDLAVAGGVYYPLDCHLSPAAVMANLQHDLERTGGRFLWERDVTGFIRDGRRVRAVQTQQGDVEADEFVLCAGAWSPLVVRDLGLRLPIQAGKGYSLTREEPRQLPNLCGILTEARVAMTPIGKTLRFGGTMEIAGLDERISPRRIQGIIKSVCRYMPGFTPRDFAGIEPWVGLRPCAPDGLPYLGRPRGWDNLVVNTGHAMMGVSLAPVSAALTADTLEGRAADTSADHTALELLSPNRFN